MRIGVKAPGLGAQQKIRRKTLSPIWTQYSDQILAPNSAAAFIKSENALILHIGRVGELRAAVSSRTGRSPLA
jgi:hypothetical protein